MPIKHRQPPAPELNASGKAERFINPARLDAGRKKQLWNGIKTKSPELADLLVENGDISALKSHFDGEILISEADYLRFIDDDD